MNEEKITLGVLYLEREGDPRSAKTIVVEVDPQRSQRHRLFRSLGAVPKSGHFVCCFDGDGNIYWLDDAPLPT